MFEAGDNLIRNIDALSDGTYVLENGNIHNYAARWSFGYIVGVRALELTDLRNYVVIGVWHDEDGTKYLDLVKHIHAYSDAIKFAKDHDQKAIYDLREEKVVFV